MMKALRSCLLFLAVVLPVGVGQTGTPEPPTPAAVRIYADGEIQAFESTSTTPDALLAEAGLALEPGDRLLQNGLVVSNAADLSGSDPIVLQVERAAVLILGQESLATPAQTVAAALWEMGLALRISDELTPSPETALVGEMRAEWVGAERVVFNVSGEAYRTRTAARTVGDALQDGGFPLQGLDYSVPDAAAAVPDGESIQVVRVEEEIILEQASIPFETLTQPAPDVDIDTQQVVQVGQFGLQVSRIRVRYEDGVEVSRQTEAEWVAVQPSPRILGYGTNIVVKTLNTPGGSIEYWRSVPAYATSYSPCRLGVSTCGNTTASGLPLKKGVAGVIRSWYNAMVFSQVYVPGYGVATIADIGAGVSGQHWIDLGYSDDDWVSWHETVTVYFLTPVPPLDQVLWILP